MIDIRLLQKDFDTVASALKRKKVDENLIEQMREVSLEAKSKRQEMEGLQAQQNQLSSQFGMYKKEGKDIAPLQAQISELKTKKQDFENEVRVLEEKLESIVLAVPNMPDSEVPDGADENDNIVLEVIGEKPQFNFAPKEHWELGENNGWLDFERGVKLAKSRFSALSGTAARLERALINYMLDFNAKRGFKEWYVPFMANANTLQGTGQLPKFEEDLFKIEGENLYLIPTAEVSLTNLYNDEILEEDQLPLLLTSYTPCFRKEAGSAGRDTRGLIRQHQFNKVELVKITTPETSDLEHKKLLEDAERILQKLNLHYRVVELCGADLGFSASKCFDIEVWLPGQDNYREISSVSNFLDFQARRAKIRYKSESEKKNSLAHTINGSGLAVGRTVVAIFENYQQEDGSIIVPEVLRPYMGGLEIIPSIVK